MMHVDRLLTYLDFAEHEWIAVEDIFDPAVASTLLTSLYGLVTAVLAERPDAHFAHEDPTTLLRARTGVDAMVALLRPTLAFDIQVRDILVDNIPGEFSALSADLTAAMLDRHPAIKLREFEWQGWVLARDTWRARGSGWEFWVRWYEDILAGREPDWEYLVKVAGIPDEIWQQGPEAAAAEIARIEAQHSSQGSEDTLDRHLKALPDPAGETVAKVRAAMERNREALPPTFDAIEGLILLELDRLHGKNYVDELDHAELQRQRRVFLILYEAVQRLRVQLPNSGSVSSAQAERSERALRLIFKKVGELPIKKADEIADNLWGVGERAVQACLIAGTTALATAYDCPMALALTAGTFVFAPSKAADIIRTAKEALLGPK